MTHFSARKRHRALLVAATVAASTIFASVSRAETIAVRLDQAKISRLPNGVSTIVVGNPLIADVSLQQGGLMVITGKGYGSTNLIALDRGGTVLSEQLIQVQGPGEGVVTLYRGVNRESYSCTPSCDRRITLGDSAEYFTQTIQQTSGRNGLAQGAANTGQPGAR